MSLSWVIRLGLIAVLFALVALARWLLGDRRRHARTLENTPLAILHVLAYNACCYLSAAIPADPGVLSTPPVLQEPFVVRGFQALGALLLLSGVCLFVLTVRMRGAIGGQDTGQGLITSGPYRFSRHPIYLGIVLVSLSLALITANLDGMVVFPLLLLANGWQAAVEEKYDVGVRFREAYAAYRRTAWMLGPPWFWLVLVGVSILVLTLGGLGELGR